MDKRGLSYFASQVSIFSTEKKHYCIVVSIFLNSTKSPTSLTQTKFQELYNSNMSPQLFLG